ncbi:MAG: hypothetical protein IJX96_03670 [Clostridia bacterium]|nr:hypothetical protein [Clostridia bacterium]
MIDMHTHVLPDLDDGAKNEREAQAILEMELAQGVQEVVFTPHYYGKKRSVNDFLEQREKALQKIADRIPEGLKTRLGAEVRLTGVNDPSSDALCKLAIEGTKCVLVELPFTERWNQSLITRLSEFVGDTDYTPVIAHIERYQEVWKNPAIISAFVKMGCLIQVNTAAFLDKKMRKFAFALLKRGLVHCLGTDAHNADTRAPDYAKAKEAAYAAGYGKEWERVQRHMDKIFAGESVCITCEPIHKFLWWYV